LIVADIERMLRVLPAKI
jgi:hypothetical protein